MSNSCLLLGTGGSMGIPVIGCDCSVCQSENPKNKRLRPSALLEIEGKKILIDPGIDLRQQVLSHQIQKLDGVLITHSHQDHVGGLDDLRVFYMFQKKPIPLLLSDDALQDITSRFHYIFAKTPQNPTILPKFEIHTLFQERGSVEFLGIPLTYFSYRQAGMRVLGFRVGSFAYVTDIIDYEDSVFDDLKGVKTLVVSALRHKPSVLHFTLEQAVAFAKRVGVQKAYFTHIAHELDHEAASQLIPPHMELGYDGKKVFF